MKTAGPFKFFESDPEHPWRRSKAWAIPSNRSAQADLDAWNLSLDPPPEQSQALPLHDLKSWVLHDDQPDRYLNLGNKEGTTDLRRVNRDAAMESYLQQLIARLPPRARESLSITMPAIDDNTTRARYLSILNRVAPHARVLSEPEMVVEYFRLIRRSLSLDPDRNNIALVIDIGASTSDLSIVTSNRRGEVIGGTTTRRRDARLRAIQGGCDFSAGQWVDEQLLQIGGISLHELDHQARQSALDAVESAKIEVSLTQRSTYVSPTHTEGFELTPDHLRSVSSRLVEQLRPVLEIMSERLWKQQTGTPEAADLSHDAREERGVVNESHALRLVDFLVLAGGTSLLLGLREEIVRILEPGNPSVLEVASDFPVAAALGGLAHQLATKHRPPLIQSGTDRDKESAPLIGALDSDILFAWKASKKESEQREILIARGDPIVYQGGSRESVLTLPAKEGSDIYARLISSSREHRQGARPQALHVVRNNPNVGLDVQDNGKAHVHSDEMRNAAALVIDLEKVGQVQTRRSPEPSDTVNEGHVRVYPSDETVIDFGMSKTVIVGSDGGEFDPMDLERMFSSFQEATRQRDNKRRRTERPTPNCWTSEAFSNQLHQIHRQLHDYGTDVPLDDLAFVLLATGIRPAVLLAGPPGSGKTTLARLVARLLGTTPGDSFHEISVQPHWESDSQLFGKNGLLLNLIKSATYQVVLLDEINLTRPEYYAATLLAALESDTPTIHGERLAPCSVLGTLNIDDTSRPPSPKVIDRCFMVEIEPPLVDASLRWNGFPSDLLPLGRPNPNLNATNTQAYRRVLPILKAIEDSVRTHHLRLDLLPSRRALKDLMLVLTLHSELGLSDAISEDDVIDRTLIGRVFSKFGGAAEQVEPVLKSVEAVLPETFSRCRAKLELAKHQIELGFVSPWQ